MIFYCMIVYIHKLIDEICIYVYTHKLRDVIYAVLFSKKCEMLLIHCLYPINYYANFLGFGGVVYDFYSSDYVIFGI